MRDSRPPRILHLIASNFFGGPERQILSHLRRLDASRFRGGLCSFVEEGAENGLLEAARAAGIDAATFPWRGVRDAGAVGRLRERLAAEEVRVLCTHGYRSTVIGFLAARGSGTPVLAFSRGYTAENWRVAFYEWLERRVLPRVDGVVCVSRSQAERLRASGVRPRRTWVVLNAVTDGPARNGGARPPVEEARARLGTPPGAALILCAGRLSPEKGHRYLVDAIARLSGGAPPAVFVFCGDGACRARLEKQARRLRIQEYCRFVGFRKDLAEIIPASDLLVLPSLTEGLPNVVLEALAAGRAVVATAVGGVPELIEDGRTGLLVPPRDPSRLAGAILRCLSSPALRDSLGKAGLETVRARFSPDEQTRRLEAVYEEVLLRRDGGSYR